MDPQKLSQLDPKLREAYQRVMGTTIPEPQAKSDLAQAAPIQAQTPLPTDLSADLSAEALAEVEAPAKVEASAKANDPIPSPQPAPAIPEPIAEPQPVINPQPAIPPQQASNFVQMNSEAPTSPAPTPNFTTPAAFDAAPIQTQAIVVKKKNNILMLTMIGITILVFIAVYSLFWVKIFNFKLPFLP
jgi:hypothetical protein